MIVRRVYSRRARVLQSRNPHAYLFEAGGLRIVEAPVRLAGDVKLPPALPRGFRLADLIEDGAAPVGAGTAAAAKPLPGPLTH